MALLVLFVVVPLLVAAVSVVLVVGIAVAAVVWDGRDEREAARAERALWQAAYDKWAVEQRLRALEAGHGSR